MIFANSILKRWKWDVNIPPAAHLANTWAPALQRPWNNGSKPGHGEISFLSPWRESTELFRFYAMVWRVHCNSTSGATMAKLVVQGATSLVCSPDCFKTFSSSWCFWIFHQVGNLSTGLWKVHRSKVLASAFSPLSSWAVISYNAIPYQTPYKDLLGCLPSPALFEFSQCLGIF